MIPPAAAEWLRYQGFGEVVSSRPVGGGCINHGARIQTGSGISFFIKTNTAAPERMFACEAAGLEALRVPGGPRLPRPCVYDRTFILMEDLAPADKIPAFWSDFGTRLAALHSHTAPRFGFDHDNFIGSTPQPNPWTDGGYDFFAHHRILFQVKLARQNGLLGEAEARQAERLAQRLPELLPDQPASLLHGDLWSGNAIADNHGDSALIDPAAHYGWAEAELAMTALFGGFPPEFYEAYTAARPVEPSYRQRFPLYNLYHLLNHLNLFGSGYSAEVQSILRRYGN